MKKERRGKKEEMDIPQMNLNQMQADGNGIET
jgi:hypothetical protein